MAMVAVVGGGVAGLVTGLALRHLGHQVHVLDREPGPLPASVRAANADWVRPTVPQALHSHAFTSLGAGLLRTRLPEVYAALSAAGATEISLLSAVPADLRAALPDIGPDELTVLACRRRTFDFVLATEARRLGVPVRPAATVRALELSGVDTPRVTGVRLADGELIAADLVVDATGRAAESRRWLTTAGLDLAPDTTWDSELTCYTRFYRGLGTGLPGVLNRGNAAGAIFGHYLAFAHPGDNGTFSLGIGVLPDDPPLKVLRDEAAFTALLAATPLLAPWLAEEASEPISPVHAITVPPNTVRGVATGRQRPVPGLLPIGDAAATSNPLYGRGVSLAIAHAVALADLIAEIPEPGQPQTDRAVELVETLLTPWVRQAADDDAERIRLWRTVVHGEQYHPLPTDHLGLAAAARASAFDPVVWHRLARAQMSLDDPAACYDDPDIRARAHAALAGREPPTPAAPDREQTLRLLDEVGR